MNWAADESLLIVHWALIAITLRRFEWSLQVFLKTASTMTWASDESLIVN